MLQTRSARPPFTATSSLDPDPEVSSIARRRTFKAKYKLEILEKARACSKPGEIGKTSAPGGPVLVPDNVQEREQLNLCQKLALLAESRPDKYDFSVRVQFNDISNAGNPNPLVVTAKFHDEWIHCNLIRTAEMP